MKIKVNTSGNDCRSNDEIVCPYCGAIHGDSYEYGDGEIIGEMECEYCGREFIANRNFTISYSSRPLGLKAFSDWEKGDIFDDGITEAEAERWANENGIEPCEVVKEDV